MRNAGIFPVGGGGAKASKTRLPDLFLYPPPPHPLPPSAGKGTAGTALHFRRSTCPANSVRLSACRFRFDNSAQCQRKRIQSSSLSLSPGCFVGCRFLGR
jgi:hypothetical protein